MILSVVISIVYSKKEKEKNENENETLNNMDNFSVYSDEDHDDQYFQSLISKNVIQRI
jgi:hypothetical protein